MNTKEPWKNNWNIEKRLGGGGQGRTYLVRHIEKKSMGVLKILRRQNKIKDRMRMRKEVVNLNLVFDADGKVPEVFEENTVQYKSKNISLYIVMEYIQGKSLEGLVHDSNGLNLDQAGKILFDLCFTVEKGFSYQVIHRDLKPENIIIRDQKKPDVVIVDYGLSFNQKNVERVTSIDEILDNKFLRLPERSRHGGDRTDIRSDLTSLCGILYYCITAVRPTDLVDDKNLPPHKRTIQKLEEKLRDDPRYPYLIAFFDRGFTMDLDFRFQTMEDFHKRLKEVVDPVAKRVTMDPFNFASRSKPLFIKRNRATQIAEFKENSKCIYETLKSIREKYSTHQLKPYSLSSGGYDGKFSLSEGENLNIIFTQQINVENNPQNVMIVYEVRAKGLECEVYRSMYKRAQHDRGQWDIANKWKCIHRYNGLSIPSQEDLESIKQDFTACISDACAILEKEIILIED